MKLKSKLIIFTALFLAVGSVTAAPADIEERKEAMFSHIRSISDAAKPRAATAAEKQYLCDGVNNFLAENGYDRAVDMIHCLTEAEFHIQTVPEATVIVKGSLLYNTPEMTSLKMSCHFAYNGSEFSIDNVIQEPLCK